MAKRYPSEDEGKEYRAQEGLQKSDEVTLTHAENRTYEMQIGPFHVRFDPHESKSVPRWLLDHPDFQNQKKRFLIKE